MAVIWADSRRDLRGRFGIYVPPLMEAFGLAELNHDLKNSRMRAVQYSKKSG